MSLLKLKPNKNTDGRLQLIINLEGIDGTGKATVSGRLKEIMEGSGLKVFTLHFPVYETQSGNLVKSFLVGDLIGDPTEVDPILASLYYLVDRLTYFKNNPQIFTDYDVLIFDRSYMSNFFFQTVKYGKDNDKYMDNIVYYIKTMCNLEIMNSPLKKYLDIMRTFQLFHPQIETNFMLMERRGEALDMHESNKTYLKDIQDNASYILKNRLELIHRLSNEEYRAYDFMPIKCSTSPDSLRPIVDIANNIISELDSCYWL